MLKNKALSFILLFLTSFLAAQVSQGGGDIPIPVPEHPCLSPEAYAVIEQEINENRASLIDQGILPETPDDRAKAVQLDWPLKQANGFNQPSYYTTVNFVDLDPGTGIQDFQCNSRSYNGHKGLDISSWPFWWQMMEDNQVDIIAGAPGVIINKSDDYFDQNCSCVGTWNAVYIQHSDGSIAWYGHMKKNTLTAKPWVPPSLPENIWASLAVQAAPRIPTCTWRFVMHQTRSLKLMKVPVMPLRQVPGGPIRSLIMNLRSIV